MVNQTRRDVLKGTVAVTGVSGLASITRGATDSGNPELEVIGVQRENTQIIVEIINNESNNMESVIIGDDTNFNGSQTFELDLVGGTDTEITDYEFNVELNGGVNTPDVDSITLTLPAEDDPPVTEPPTTDPTTTEAPPDDGDSTIGNVIGLDWLFASVTTFLFFCIFIMTVGTFGGTKQIRASIKVSVLVLVYASYSGNEYLTGILYVVIILIALLLSNQMFGLLFGDGDSGEV